MRDGIHDRCRPFSGALAAALLFSTAAAAAPLSQGRDPATGLRYWQWRDGGILFKLTQRLPDQSRGFFQARGFDPGTADRVARACVFQSMFKNTGAPDSGTVSIDLNTWRVLTAGGPRRLRLREDWAREWPRELDRAARIAFEWSLLPTRQSYAPGDYNWGMTLYGLPPGARFDLEFRWSRDRKVFKGTFRNVECAPDIHLEPAGPG